ncbi:cytochrome P450 [Nemania sp. FL0031]|nr:cytochrome P450 [Nemania sp. FL0031]
MILSNFPLAIVAYFESRPEAHLQTIVLVITSALTLRIIYFLLVKSRSDDIPILNQSFKFEPSILARWRWGLQSKIIMADGYRKFNDRVWRLVRGDRDFLILPYKFLPELNRLSQDTISSRKYHTTTMLSELTGMSIIKHTNHHVKILLSRVTPALPRLLNPMAKRTWTAIERVFPQQHNEWIEVAPLFLIVECITEGIAIALVGPNIPQSSELVEILSEHTKNIFTTVFILRFFPEIIQPYVRWLFPVTWHLQRTWKSLERFVVPEILHRKHENSVVEPAHPDLVTWMVKEGRGTLESDPKLLTRLVGSVGSGGTYSTANFVLGVMADLAAHREATEELRHEIREKHHEINGIWDDVALSSLLKLESVMKETSRLAPSSLTMYGRHILKDYVLSNGLLLKKGQALSVSSYAKSMEPSDFENPEEYKAMRFYNRGQDDLRARPFVSIDGEILTWGSGRWACPGRFVANVAAKLALIKLIDEYDFELADRRKQPNLIMHEFIFVHPYIRIMLRRREDSVGIQ